MKRAMLTAIADVADEVDRVDAARGLDLGTTWGSGGPKAEMARGRAQSGYDEAERAGVPTFALALREECYEALAESDPVKLRAELVQVAAVALRWIRAIDAGAERG